MAGLLGQPRTVRSSVEPTDAGDRLIGMVKAGIAPAGRDLMIGVFDKVLIESIGNGKPADLEGINKHPMNR